MHQFTERHAAFKGFSTFYEKNIRHSSKVLWRRNRYVILVIFLGMALLCLLALFRMQLVSIIISGIGFLIYLYLDANKYKLNIENHYLLAADIAEYVGLKSMPNFSSPLLLWKDLGLIEDYWIRNEVNLKLEGEYKGHALTLIFLNSYAAHTRYAFSKNSFNDFSNGLLICLKIGKPFSGRTVVKQDQGVSQPRFINGMKRVGIVDPVFERDFEVYSTDQIESRALLSPDLIQEIVDLNSIFGSKAIEFGFIAGQLLISMPKSSLVERRIALDSGAYDFTVAQNFIDEISSIFDVVDFIAKK